MTTKEDQLLQELRITLSKMELSLDAIEDAIVWVDENGTIQWSNKNLIKLVKFSIMKFLENLIQIFLYASFIYPKNRQEEFYYATDQVKSGKPFKITDTERIHKDGHIIPVSVMMSPILNEQGEVIGSCSIARNISELKEMMAAKNDFIST